MGHKQNSTIDISWIFWVSFGVSIDKYQIWFLGYKLEIPIPGSSILKEGEVPNKWTFYWFLSPKLGFKIDLRYEETAYWERERKNISYRANA